MDESSSAPSGKTLAKPRRGLSKWVIILLLALVVVVILFIWAEQKRRRVSQQLEATTQELEQVKQATQRSGPEAAKEVLNKVRTHIDVPEQPEPTVATVIDAEQLRQSHPFYKNAQNGDHLILTETRAILYSPDRDRIIDIVPVRIDRSATSEPTSTSNTSTQTSPAPTSDQ